MVKIIQMTKDPQVAGSSSAGHAILYKESALTFEGWNTAELHEQVEMLVVKMWPKLAPKATFEYNKNYLGNFFRTNGDCGQ